jgi:hypothetical protein
MSRQEQGAVEVVALRHDDEASLAVDVARPDDRGDGSKTREIAIDHVRRHTACNQSVAHRRRLVVTVAFAVAAHDQVLDLARPPQVGGGIEPTVERRIRPARRIVGDRAQHQGDIDLGQAADVIGGIGLAPARHHLIGRHGGGAQGDQESHESRRSP